MKSRKEITHIALLKLINNNEKFKNCTLNTVQSVDFAASVVQYVQKAEAERGVIQGAEEEKVKQQF